MRGEKEAFGGPLTIGVLIVTIRCETRSRATPSDTCVCRTLFAIGYTLHCHLTEP
jgi:hypothetical protein